MGENINMIYSLLFKFLPILSLGIDTVWWVGLIGFVISIPLSWVSVYVMAKSNEKWMLKIPYISAPIIGLGIYYLGLYLYHESIVV